ncbi:MAG: SPFH domain-containing protein [Myxococcales bacterium]|nr:SPFH domain-containing protein [Myxococcales bacterium]
MRINGFVMLGVLIAATAGAAYAMVHYRLPAMGALGFFALLMLKGFFAQAPNRARVLTFFGTYIGTISEPGFFWTNPLASRRVVTLRVQNFHSRPAKVNDAQGNPIEMGAVFVWRVVDAAAAIFEVESCHEFVATQFETAVRSTASRYPYDHINGEDDETPSLRCNRGAIAAALAEEARQRVALAGVEVLEARISDLAYAPEIAQAMLKRQQAQAIIAARQLIVDGAVGMVEQALARIDNGKMVKLSDEQKASMVNNLLVVLTSDNEATPVVSTG